MQQAEDNMNLLMLEVTLTNRDGSTQPLQSAYIRGSQVRYLILPDMLKVRGSFNEREREERGRDQGVLSREI